MIRKKKCSNQSMTDLFSPLGTSTPPHPPSVSRFFQPSESGRDSPRTLVAEELLKFHISPPTSENEILDSSISLHFPSRELRGRSRLADSISVSPSNRPSPITSSSTVRRSPRITAYQPVPQLEKMEVDFEDPVLMRPRCSRSPPPLSPPSDDSDDLDKVAMPMDERTKYLRRKKRAEQIASYRSRELKEGREARSIRRNNSLSPKSTRVTKGCTKKVKFVI